MRDHLGRGGLSFVATVEQPLRRHPAERIVFANHHELELAILKEMAALCPNGDVVHPRCQSGDLADNGRTNDAQALWKLSGDDLERSGRKILHLDDQRDIDWPQTGDAERRLGRDPLERGSNFCVEVQAAGKLRAGVIDRHPIFSPLFILYRALTGGCRVYYIPVHSGAPTHRHAAGGPLKKRENASIEIRREAGAVVDAWWENNFPVSLKRCFRGDYEKFWYPTFSCCVSRLVRLEQRNRGRQATATTDQLEKALRSDFSS